MVRRIAGEIHGFLVALLTTLILGSVLALIVYWSPLKETLLDPWLIYPYDKRIHRWLVFSLPCRQPGLVRGVIIGLLFFTLMLLVTLVVNPALVSFGSFIKDLLFAVACGGLGGILGVGMAG